MAIGVVIVLRRHHFLILLLVHLPVPSENGIPRGTGFHCEKSAIVNLTPTLPTSSNPLPAPPFFIHSTNPSSNWRQYNRPWWHRSRRRRPRRRSQHRSSSPPPYPMRRWTSRCWRRKRNWSSCGSIRSRWSCSRPRSNSRSSAGSSTNRPVRTSRPIWYVSLFLFFGDSFMGFGGG